MKRCKSGIVNMYKLEECLLKRERNPKPLKTFMNLTTPCTSIKFNRTNEILSICSAFSENACKLVISLHIIFAIRLYNTCRSNFICVKQENNINIIWCFFFRFTWAQWVCFRIFLLKAYLALQRLTHKYEYQNALTFHLIAVISL